MLSWFARDGKRLPPAQLRAALAALTATCPDLGIGADCASLLARVLAERADMARALDPFAPRALLAPATRPQVLLFDQRVTGPAHRAAFARMLAAARAAHPGAAFWIWPTATGRAGGLKACPRLPDCKYLPVGHSLFATLEKIDHAYTVDAPIALQALLARVPLHVSGQPFYAGTALSPEALFDALYLRLAAYLDPATHAAGTLSSVLDAVAVQRAVRARYAGSTHVTGLGFQIWKRHFARPYLSAGGGELRWGALEEASVPQGSVALWGAREARHLPAGTPLVRIEDGFFHSDGLGSDMSPPRSQVLDREGLYFDASRPSELTRILNETAFPPEELARAARLRQLVAQCGVTKYNLGRRAPAWTPPAGRTIILVPGQVANDASIRLGTGEISTAERLLAEVRRRHPDGFIVYKPHPDVLSGNRPGLVEAHELADIVDASADLLSLIECADEVHVLSSLAGFDALLRGKRVFTYGMPFYAGWGLTTDALPQRWRARGLSLDMLVAGALLRYPVYWDWRMRMFTTPEAVVAQLAVTAGRPLEPVAQDRMRLARKIVRWSRNALHYGCWVLERGVRMRTRRRFGVSEIVSDSL